MGVELSSDTGIRDNTMHLLLDLIGQGDSEYAGPIFDPHGTSLPEGCGVLCNDLKLHGLCRDHMCDHTDMVKSV